MQSYFRDWIMLRAPPHLHSCVERLPLTILSVMIDSLFDDAESFLENWDKNEGDVIAALELVSVTAYASKKDISWSKWVGGVRNWKAFAKAAARMALETLSTPEVLHKQNRNKFLQSISSIEVSLSYF